VPDYCGATVEKRAYLVFEALLYLVSSFWLGALHAATPGHGKTIAASYIVGARGRPVDALVLGIFVTLSHTSGIILVAVLATMGSAWLIPQRVEAYLAVGMGVLVIGIGFWMLRTQGSAIFAGGAVERSHSHPHLHDRDAHDDDHGHAHEPELQYHRHGWGARHAHNIDALTDARPRLAVLLALGIAGGLLPDPGALAILLASIGSGKLMLGLFTVLVFSLGFASVLVAVGVVAARVGRLVLAWLSSRWMSWLQAGAALLIVGVGIVLTLNAWRAVAALR
jgi:nickel/cobalt transporter (NicO) family protein